MKSLGNATYVAIGEIGMKTNKTKRGVYSIGIKLANAIALLMFVFAGTPVAVAQSSVDTMLQQADLVFDGVVTDRQYRFSTKSTDSDPDPTPYTFVTYRINSILKGNYQGNTVILRFMGGPINAN